jgi:hypothetical protein
MLVSSGRRPDLLSHSGHGQLTQMQLVALVVLSATIIVRQCGCFVVTARLQLVHLSG